MEILKFIQSFANPFLDKFFLTVTVLGEEYLAMVVLLLFLWCKDKKLGYKLGLSLSFSFLINGLIKDIVKEARPIGKDGIRSLRAKTATGYSFPSGHTQNTATLWTTLILHFKNKKLTVIGIIFTLLVGLSRIYLGLHWTRDVVGGLIFAILSVFISNIIFDSIEKAKDKKIVVMLCALSIIGMSYFKSVDYAKAVGMFLGFLIGYSVENKYINLEMHKNKIKNTIRFILGLFILVVIKIILKKVPAFGELSYVINYGIIVMWCTIGAPYAFKKLNI
ncbi:phosphatase PAP2 family protein [Haloimpatiens sp. FM7315]|uniref:phosphatase PAP2 family protein n=1 Tax=Haloimpatiens sp. FM7315 TaxID=3298609 RepID=UPI0035A2B481